MVRAVHSVVTPILTISILSAVGFSARALANTDCNANGKSDAQDIAAGTSADCNTNGVPDECDLGTTTNLVPLSATDAHPENRFGFCAAIGPGVVAIGAPDADGTGAVYVFEQIEGIWLQSQKLTANDAANGDALGYSVAVADRTVVAGAYGDDDLGADSGAAYVFQNSDGTWHQVAKLHASDGDVRDYFGWSVAATVDRIIVGAYGNNDGGTDTGSAYVFDHSSGQWVQRVKLNAPDAAALDYFGTSVAIIDDIAAIGAPGDDNSGANSGSAYLFRPLPSGYWTYFAKVRAADAAAGDYFGYTVALTDGVLLIGAPYDDDAGNSSGAAYLFEDLESGWTQSAKLVAPDAAANDRFGAAVAVGARVCLIGAYGADGFGPDAGAAYIFRNDVVAWTPIGAVFPGEVHAYDYLGASVALDGNTILVGAYGDTAAETPSGRAWVLDLVLSSRDCDGDALPDECGIALGLDTDCDRNGLADSCEIAQDPLRDCNHNHALDECEPPFNRDCNTNGTPDACDIGAGTSQDCNSNGRPDECDLRGTRLAAKLKTEPPAGGAQLGEGVAVLGDTAVFGAPGAGSGYRGRAYVYHRVRGLWQQVEVLEPDDLFSGDDFGASVAMSGDLLATTSVPRRDTWSRPSVQLVYHG
ncbi:MAG: FG-GAP repeat protein [Phycisphaerales bacterium]|nr:FG-GAP repeat protein [Phycisphaerales bacterium]